MLQTTDANTISGVTYAGVSMTRIVGAAGDRFQVFALANPASGANNIVVTQTQFMRMACVSISHTGVNTALYTGTAESANALTDTVNVSDDQQLVSIVGVTDFDQPAGPLLAATGTSQTERVETQQTYFYIAASTQDVTGAPTTATWTFGGASTDELRIAAIQVNGIASSGPSAAAKAAYRRNQLLMTE